MKHKISIIVAALLIFVLALGITLYPLISNYVNQKYASTIYTKYEEMIQNVDETELQEARSLAQSYNQALAPVSSYDKEGISEASHNYDSLLNLGGNGIMGYIEIPCIQVNLPIYHGTDTETLERGVGHLLGSSLPVGGSSTHAVLSGHSGMAAAGGSAGRGRCRRGEERCTGRDGPEQRVGQRRRCGPQPEDPARGHRLGKLQG